MFSVLINLLAIQIIAVVIIDISGFVPNLKRLISKILTRGRISTANYTLKPIDCSFCTTFWASLIYLIISGTFSLTWLAVALLFATFSPATESILYNVRDKIIKFFR